MRKIIIWLAHQFGFFVISKETYEKWLKLATEHNKIAADYEFSDERLCGINQGILKI